jgi:hypothetical protein
MRSLVVAAALAVTGALGFADKADAQVYVNTYSPGGGLVLSIGGGYGYPGWAGYNTNPSYYWWYTNPSYYSWYSSPYRVGYRGGYYRPYYGAYRWGGSLGGWRGGWRRWR